MKKTTHLVICAALALTTVQGNAQHPWQMFHNNRQHAGYADVKGPQSATVRWKYFTGTTGFEGGNSVAISSAGTIYVCGPGKITALDRGGNLKWTKPYPGAQGPAISKDGSRIFIVSNTNIVALDTLGNQQWIHAVGDTMIFGVTLSEDDSTLYQGCWDHYVYALKTSDGSERWKYLTQGCVSYSVTIHNDGTVLVGGGDAHCGSDSTVYALNPDGSFKWKYIVNGTGGVHCGTPVIGPDSLIYVAAQPTLYVLNNNGQLQWSVGSFSSQAAGIIAPAITPDTTIYAGTNQGILNAISGKTHTIKWSYQTGPDPNQSNFYGIISFPVADKEGTVFTGAVDNKVYAIDKNGALKWSYTTGGRISEASPALDTDGTLYITSDDGYLYAFWDTVSVTGMAQSRQAGDIAARLFPDPCNGKFTLLSEQVRNGQYCVEIYNMVGEKIYSSSCHLPNSVVDISSQPDGIYLVKIITGNASAVSRLAISRY